MSTKRLADEAFVQETVSRSLPSLTRPRLRTESEHRLAEVERRAAESYAHIETLTRKAQDLAEKLDEPPEAVPVAVPAWEDTSMVNHIEDVRIQVEVKTSK